MLIRNEKRKRKIHNRRSVVLLKEPFDMIGHNGSGRKSSIFPHSENIIKRKYLSSIQLQ
jgi:hypothetical protein